MAKNFLVLSVVLTLVHGNVAGNSFKTVLKSDPEPFVLSKEMANNFIRSSGKRVRRDLWEECYDEGCSMEEVEEVVGGHAMYQYYYGWRCMRLYGWHFTYSYNPHRLQCVNSLVGLNTCARGTNWLSNGQSRACNLGGAKVVMAVYIENGCNNGQLGSYELIFDDPDKSVRKVYNMGCREKKTINQVIGARSFVAKLIGGGRLANQHIGWFGYNSHYCGHPGNPTNGYIIGKNFYRPNTVTYKCHNGYVLVGATIRLCWSYGWLGRDPACKRICGAGTFSSTGYEPCSPCALGTYQPNQQKTSCLVCPSGTSTSKTGRRFLSECHPKCSQAVCTLTAEWSQWADSSTPLQSSCASQKRTRTYQISWQQVVNSGGCDSVSKTCPADPVEHRTKEVYCDPLDKPDFGYYEPAGCTTTKQTCRTTTSSTCIFYCNSTFERIGSSSDVRRTCQSNGQWSYSEARCKDITAPTITCPANQIVGNDDGKPYARITLGRPTVSDNSGKEPSFFITTPNIQPVQEFPIADNPTKIEYKAVDEEGLSKTCSFYVQVKDVEKPLVTYCPTDYTIYTKVKQTNIMFKEPTFKDNFDPTPDIKKSHTPGQPLLWNTYRIIYNATDDAGNMASCSYNLQVSPMRCTLYDPPDNGIRSCNINLSGVAQEYICTVQCRNDFDFVTKPGYSSYNCKEDGNWYGHKMMSSFELLTIEPGKKPWPDCSVKSTPTGMTKKATVYAGTCLSEDEATRTKIKQNFINTLKSDFFLNFMMCSNGVDCQLNNVKVYCGKNSRRKRRGLNENVYVIHVDMDLLDLAPSPTESEERLRIKSYADAMELNKQKVEDSIKKAAASAVNAQSDTVDIEDETVTGACAVGKVVLVKDGVGTGLERSECVDCSFGTYYDMASKTCILCSKGTYQDEEGKQNCKTCPLNTDTKSVGAKSAKDCREYCKKGEYSASGLATCTACPKGEYQPNMRGTSCLKCPDGTSTIDIATQSLEDCKKYCAAGYFAKEGGLGACVPCPRGSYQPHDKGINCINCPAGMTTANDASTSSTECKAHCGMDFEDGHNNWTRTGTAFNNQPTYGDNPRHRNRESSQLQGNWWIGGFENRPSPSNTAGHVQGDGSQGTMTSPSFVITGNELSFLIGGGCDINVVRVELLIESVVVYKETGRCSESMLRKFWNVSSYKGKTAHVRLVDHSSGGWGHINFDDLRGDTCI